MDKRDPDSLEAKVKQEHNEVNSLAKDILNWFLDNDRVGELYPKDQVIEQIQEEFEISSSRATKAVSSLVGDIVDPVQQVIVEDKRHVGIIEYRVDQESGSYGYIHFDDISGQRKRVVCGKCVEQETRDKNVTHATEGESCEVGCTWDDLTAKMLHHYQDAHDADIDEIEPGASLLDGTTISGNLAIHTGNDGQINHDELNNRTHDGDALTPSSIDVNNSFTGPNGNVIDNFVGQNLEIIDGRIDAGRNHSTTVELNRLQMNISALQYDLGLDLLDYPGGLYDLFVDGIDSAEKSNVELDGEELDLVDEQNNGELVYKQDFNIIPFDVVFAYRGAIDEGNIEVEIEDANGDSVTVNRVDDIVGTEDLKTKDITVTVKITEPGLKRFGLYFDGARPDQYYETAINSITEA
jgi:hypothetical protein